MRRDRRAAEVWLPLVGAFVGWVCARSGLLVDVTTIVYDYNYDFLLGLTAL